MDHYFRNASRDRNNGDGLKVQRVGPDGTTRYYYDGIRPIWETDGTGVMTAELDHDIFGNLLSRLDSSGARRYYHTDGLGSTIALTDATGIIAASMLYDAWGNVRVSGADVGKYRFTGAEYDSTTGLYHMGARFYDPSVGRWLSEDPVGGGANAYAYAAMNPLSNVDPTGTMERGTDGLDPGVWGGEPSCDACDQRNTNAFAARSTSDPAASYAAWLGATQRGVTPPSGWQKYADLVLKVASQTGVPAAEILAVMCAEAKQLPGGGFDPNYVEPAGGIGLMQVTPAVGRMFGVYDPQLLKDPAINILTGAKYLEYLGTQTHGNLTETLSAYNQGLTGMRTRGVEFNKAYWETVLGYMEWFKSRYP